MATQSALADIPGTAPEAHDQPHVTDVHYVRIAVILAVLTAIEVAMSYINGLDGLFLVIPLLIIMGVKFAIVALHFMHLKWDSKVLTRVFYAGLFLAVFVYVAALSTFHVFAGHR